MNPRPATPFDHPDSILDLRGVGFRRDEVLVLDSIDWRVSPGEDWTLLGANGSGKTTLLHVVAGYEWPTDGEVRVFDRLYGRVDLRELRKSIGWVTTSLTTRLPPERTALEHALSGIEASFGLWRKFSRAEVETAREALELLGAGGVAHRPYGVLSQGERQRVLIARALCARPALLILDEPCAGLDPVARERFLRDLERMHAGADPPATIFVTHHVEELPSFATHALALREGRVVARGPLGTTLTDDVLGEVFGAPCRLERAEGRLRLRVDLG